MLQILTRFKEKYKPLLKKGLIIEGMVVVDHARRKNAISVSKPFIFDNRNIPTSFDGIQVKKRIVGEMPIEFQIDRTQPDWHKKEYIWAPERFELFVDRALGEIKDKLNKELVNVFVPTTPNPTSGFLLMFPKEEVIFLDMSFEEASKFIVSAGTSNPKG